MVLPTEVEARGSGVQYHLQIRNKSEASLDYHETLSQKSKQANKHKQLKIK